jgi:hypothetical protein
VVKRGQPSHVAGRRALHYQNNEEPATPWGWFQSAYNFCACSMENAPGGSEMPQDDFRKNKIKSFTPKTKAYL